MTANFQIDDIVWAKMSTYPLWPGVIITPVANIVAPYIGGEPQHFVKFYGAGANNCSWIPDKNIVPHSLDLIEKARKNKSGRKQTLKQLQKAVDELEKDLKRDGLILEKEVLLQEEEAYKKKKLKKRSKKIRDQEQIEANSTKLKVSGETNKEIKKPQVVGTEYLNVYKRVIEDLNVCKSQQEIDEVQLMQEEVNEALKIHQNEDELDKSHETQNNVTEHPKMNENKKRKRDQEQMEAKSKMPKVSGETNKEISHKIQDNVTEHPKLNENKKRKRDQEQIEAKSKKPKVSGETNKEIIHKIHGEVTERPKVTENQDDDKEGGIEKQCINEVEIVEEPVLPIQDCVTGKDSTPPQQSIHNAVELILFSDEILLSEFWKNKSGKIQALEHLLKVIEVLKGEIQKEKSLEKQKFEMQVQKEEMKIIDQQVLATLDCITEDSSNSEQSIAENLEPIIFSSEAPSTEFWENVSLDEGKQTEAFLRTHFKTSSENEFDENVSIIIPIRPKDIDELQLISPQKGLNVIHKRLSKTLIKPSELAIDWNSRSDFWPKFLPSPLKFGFTGNGFLRSRIVKNLLLSKHNVTLWDDATTEDIEAEEDDATTENVEAEEDDAISENIEAEEDDATSESSEDEDLFDLHGAKRVETFEEFMENCDIIFSYWKNTRTVKSQMLRALCSVSKKVFAKKGYVELSTLDPETAYEIGKTITFHGGRFLEAAVLGDLQDAEDGNLVVLASGDQGLFDECSSTFQAFAKYSYYYRGNIGRGSIMKIGHSMIQGTALVGLAEVVAFIQSQGFEEDEFADILSLTPFQHDFWVEKAKSMFKFNYIPSRPVDDQRRDFQFGLDLASRTMRPTWACSAANEMFKQLINYGSDEDIAAIRNLYETFESKK